MVDWTSFTTRPNWEREKPRSDDYTVPADWAAKGAKKVKPSPGKPRKVSREEREWSARNGTISAPKPKEGLVERGYDALEAGGRKLFGALGYNPMDASSKALRLRQDTVDPMEFVLGPAETEMSLRRVASDPENADVGDWINSAFVVAPPFLKGAKRLGRPLAAAAERTAAGRAVKGAATAPGKGAKKWLTEVPGGEISTLGKRPAYEVKDGDMLRVARSDAAPRIVEEAKNADLPTLRAILKEPGRNQPAEVANEYTQKALGRGYDPDFAVPKTSLQRQSGIARAFRAGVEGSPEYKSAIYEAYGRAMPEVVEKAKAQNYDQLTEAAYRQLANEATQQFDTLPVRMNYHYGEGEYPTPSAMLRDVLGNGNLNVFRGGDPHPYLSDVDPATGLTGNEMFRAVHDYFGHGTTGTTFRPGGEEAAYASHHQMLSPLAQMALLSETRGQNSLVNYSPLNVDLLEARAPILAQIAELERFDRMRGMRGASAPEIAKLNAQLGQIGAETRFAPQEPLLLPPEYLDPMTEGGMPEYLRSVIRPSAPTGPERAVHLSHTEGLTATDPSFYGTGHRGDDWKARGAKGSPRQHTSFYLGPTGEVRAESMVEDVSPFAYETELSGLYDIQNDPEQLVRLARAYNAAPGETAIPDFARMVREYGYKGYRNGDFHAGTAAANVFDPVTGLRPIKKGPRGYAEGGRV